MDLKEDGTSYVLRMVAVEKLTYIRMELKMTEDDHHSLMASLQLAQKDLERVKGELRREECLIETTREAAEARKCGGRG